MAERDADALQMAARHLLQHPFTCREHDPDTFAIIRRLEQDLDRWFTQRLGYRLHVSSFTARLFKTTIVPHRPILQAPTSSQRAMSQRECTLLTLILAAVAAGPRVISLRDLIDDVRTAAADAEVTLSNEPVERRAFIVALKWMIQAGMATELHEHIDRYEQDAEADAILEIDPDRVGLLPLPALGRAETADELLDRSDRRIMMRQWIRAQLAENTVVYRSDLAEHEWSELRRRIGEEVALLDQMFDLRVETRAEGVAAIDPTGQLSDRSFPSSGTLGHAALMLIDWMISQPEVEVRMDEARTAFASMAEKHSRLWSKTKTAQLPSFLNEVIALLLDLRLLMVNGDTLTVLPAAARYNLVTTVEDRPDAPGREAAARVDNLDDDREYDDPQGSLW